MKMNLRKKVYNKLRRDAIPMSCFLPKFSQQLPISPVWGSPTPWPRSARNILHIPSTSTGSTGVNLRLTNRRRGF